MNTQSLLLRHSSAYPIPLSLHDLQIFCDHVLNTVLQALHRQGVTDGDLQDAHLHAIGIANGGPKAQALKSLCEVIVPDVNVAIEHVARIIDA